MAKRNCTEYKDLGLEIALILGRYFFRTDYLHYGYWLPGMEVEPGNMLCAQKNYCDLLISSIPPETCAILDVGCGTGKFAEDLVSRGFKVDGVSPSAMLTAQARRRLGAESIVYEARFENFQTERRYDLILFSESFQYIPMEAALQNARRFLNPCGHVLICDFFAVDPGEASPLGGGHSLLKMYDVMSEQRFTILQDRDITAETAPNLDLVRGLLERVAIPIYRSLRDALHQNKPSVYKFLTWAYRKKIAKLRRRYTGDARSSKNFARFKSYRLMVCKPS